MTAKRTIERVKYISAFSSFRSAFETDTSREPPNPTIQYIRLINVIIGAISAIAEILIGPRVLPTIKVSMNVLVLIAIDISRVGKKNSLNLSDIKL